MIEPPRSELFDDVYFSAHNGAAETKHVFFDGNNLPQAWQGGENFTIAETGFGTGLNFLLTWKLFDETVPKGAMLDYVSIEKYPLSAKEIRDGLLPFSSDLTPYLEKFLAQYPMRVPGFHRIVFDGRIALTLIFDDVNEALPEITADVDAWFLDGFTPSKNPDMWSDKVFAEMARLSHGGTSFSTFTAAGFVKRGLQATGFDVIKTKGFAHKRDMLKGVFQSDKKRSYSSNKKSILIHGAGLAGCAAACVLKQYGFFPVLYDPKGIAQEASGNIAGLINPRISAMRSAESDFYTAGFAQAVRTFSKIKEIDFRPCGSLHLAVNEDKKKRFFQTLKNWKWHSDHMQILPSHEACKIAGIETRYDALYLPDSAHVNPAALCHNYAQDVPFVETDQGDYDVHILAKGAGSVLDASLSDCPIHTVRGQVTLVKSTSKSQAVKTNICYGGYICAPVDGVHVVGSSFQPWLKDCSIRYEDDDDNLSKLLLHMPSLEGFEVVGHRAALRTASRDRFPIVGLIKDEKNKILVSTAHGSHGIISSLAAAHLLADILRGGPYSLSQSTIKVISPIRFSKSYKRHNEQGMNVYC